ncbi:aspartate/glutamate racemase family protein [Bordetella sp. BOR01]|uniref:maleate cis-trans isomerase family protein n=1 Tax=Bordetella sp. BOR01 TaxID=2854779 RepID=UPI001C43E084|nr:aspartate/glutamate racemase family protein [Bordetella sp. BOR01]MBV7481464.1 aspartate/glutamate racemase family protein [Bordetella sp. BOR01]
MNNQIRRVGILAPPGNIALERELPPLLPAQVASNHNRLSRPGSGITSESLLAMAQSIERAAFDLAQAYPEIILYGCTSGSFLAGLGREAEVAQRIADLTGIASVTTSTAVVAALRAVGARRLFLFTPYPDDVTSHEIEFLRHYGFEVGASDTFRCPTSEAIRAISSEKMAERVLQNRAAIADCDTVFISCTNLLSIDQITRLEQETGKSVVSSNQASLWTLLQHIGVSTVDIAAGSLFQRSERVEVSMPRQKVA